MRFTVNLTTIDNKTFKISNVETHTVSEGCYELHAWTGEARQTHIFPLCNLLYAEATTL